MMVPFPSPEHYVDPLDHKKRLKKGWANEYLREHPDGNGVLLPKLKEDVKKDKDAWDKILPPTHDKVLPVGKGEWKDAVAHGVAEFWTKVALAAAGLHPKDAGWLGSVIMEPPQHDKKRLETMEKYLYEGNVKHGMQFLHNLVRKEASDPETALKLAAAYPDFLRAAIALSNISERAFEYGYGQEAHEKILKGLAKPGELDALIEIMNSKFRPPHHIVKQFAYPEELEALYKVHKRFIDMFPHLFEEKKSPFEEFIPEDRRKELDEIIELEKELAEAVIQGKLKEDHIIPERKYEKLIQLKKEQYKDALRLLGLAEETPVQKQQTQPEATRTPEKPREAPKVKPISLEVRKEKEVIRPEDIDMSKVETHPETGVPIIRNGDQIVVLPPHKHPKEIPELHEEAIPPRMYFLIKRALEVRPTGISLESLDKIGSDILRLMREAREEAMRNPNKSPQEISREFAKKWEKESKKYDDIAEREAGADILRDFGRSVFARWPYTFLMLKTYNRDHFLTELAGGEVALAETIKLAKGMMAHPEKYGILEKDSKKKRDKIAEMLEEIMYKKKKVVGFAHKERASGENEV